MGIVENIRAHRFPRQSNYLGARVVVCFHFDTSMTIDGTVIRDDMEAPWQLIIRLDDGRHVLATECQYKLLNHTGAPRGGVL
jgi:hypothetical protein